MRVSHMGVWLISAHCSPNEKEMRKKALRRTKLSSIRGSNHRWWLGCHEFPPDGCDVTQRCSKEDIVPKQMRMFHSFCKRMRHNDSFTSPFNQPARVKEKEACDGSELSSLFPEWWMLTRCKALSNRVTPTVYSLFFLSFPRDSGAFHFRSIDRLQHGWNFMA